MTQTGSTNSAIDPRVKFGCGIHCCAVFEGEAKDAPFLRFPVPLREGPWHNLGKITRFLANNKYDDFIVDANTNLKYGRCTLAKLIEFAIQHDAVNRAEARSWFTDVDGRLIFQIDGMCFGAAHKSNDDLEMTFGEWLREATSEPCRCCGGVGMTWPDWDPTRTNPKERSPDAQHG